MGKPDKSQQKIQFDQRRTPKTQNEGTSPPEDRSSNADIDTESDLKQILNRMQQSLTKNDSKIDALRFCMDWMSYRLDKHTERLDQVKRRLSEVEDKQVTIAASQKKTDKLLLALQAKTEDLEVRSRLNNLRIVGVAENTNINNMERFVEQLLIDLLERKTFSDMFVVERVYHVLVVRPEPGAPPHPIIARLLSYRDRDAVLCRERELKILKYKIKITIYISGLPPAGTGRTKAVRPR
ncbi:hypothetical protein NDU88_001561 [Pleurodeles waltl]|uniref:Uncharacterized protein n=1 Tax=Pleurodeles waltl TaxID=8319 RepID=A0AAV7RB77_PLEWA|nr:hypothetical protein NDU88_001561 [Pleurodeles waltl]